MKSSAGTKLAVAVGAAAFLAFSHGPGGAKSTLLAVLPTPSAAPSPAVTIPTSVPAAGSYTPSTWAVAFLHVIGEPATACNVAAVTGWERAEGGHWHNHAAYNPLDDELPEPGSTRINDTGNGTGVMKYVSWGQGLAASAYTMRHYPAIQAALRAGNNAQRVASQVAASTWGTGQFTVTC
jgi:hypothetical protein